MKYMRSWIAALAAAMTLSLAGPALAEVFEDDYYDAYEGVYDTNYEDDWFYDGYEIGEASYDDYDYYADYDYDTDVFDWEEDGLF